MRCFPTFFAQFKVNIFPVLYPRTDNVAWQITRRRGLLTRGGYKSGASMNKKQVKKGPTIHAYSYEKPSEVSVFLKFFPKFYVKMFLRYYKIFYDLDVR